MYTARIVAAIRYAPTIIVLLLALAWGISVFYWMGFVFPPGRTGGQFHVGFACGNAGLGFRTPNERAGLHCNRGPWALCREFAIIASECAYFTRSTVPYGLE